MNKTTRNNKGKTTDSLSIDALIKSKSDLINNRVVVYSHLAKTAQDIHR